MVKEISALEKARLSYRPKLPPALAQGANVLVNEGPKTTSVANQDQIAQLFPNTYGSPQLVFKAGSSVNPGLAVNVGVVLSGGQAPGGHNVIAGLFDGLKSLNASSRLYGFLGGPSGLVDNKYIEITAELLSDFRNTGGFDIIGSGRTKLEKQDQYDKARENCNALGIKTLVVIGGDDSNTNACLLAEYYAQSGAGISVVGCPKTIDGDLKNEQIETSFGFDTACRVYSELIGNIQRDANSAKKYYHFIKLMGRSASHIALECALQARPNITLISEEVADRKQTLDEIVTYIAGIVAKRAEKGDNFGVVLIPEGLIEFIPEFKLLIQELNDLLAKEESTFNQLGTADEKSVFINHHLSKESSHVYSSLPQLIQAQLTMDRDPHGNVQVSLIETEKLLIEMVTYRLKEWRLEGRYKGSFKALSHFFGYEGRCAAPSNFDADYCYSLGYNAAAIVNTGKTGYMSSVQNLTKPATEWIAGGVPLTMMMNVERRHGADKPVIQKALVELDDAPYLTFVKNREDWALGTHYLYPGPIQYFGPAEVCDLTTKTLFFEKN